jgi:hypothetical protein
VATLSNVVFAFVPIELMAVKQTMMIKANITAYSTAVGPSSETKKRCSFVAKFFTGALPSSVDEIFVVGWRPRGRDELATRVI